MSDRIKNKMVIGHRRFSLKNGKAPSEMDVKCRKNNRPVIVVDESGSTGHLNSDEKSSRPYFTVVSSLVKDPKKFKSIVSVFPKNRKIEFKYGTSTLKDAKPVFYELSKSDFHFSERHRSRRNETFSDKEKVKEFYVESISEMIDEGNPGTPFDVIIDEPPLDAGKELKAMCKDKLDKGVRIEWFEVADSSKEHALQVNDFITGAVGDDVNGVKGKESLYAMIKEKKR